MKRGVSMMDLLVLNSVMILANLTVLLMNSMTLLKLVKKDD